MPDSLASLTHSRANLLMELAEVDNQIADIARDADAWEFVDLRAPKPDTRVVVVLVCEGEIEDALVMESIEHARWFRNGFIKGVSYRSFAWEVYIENDVDSDLDDEDAALITAVEKLFAAKRAEMQP